MQEIIMLRKSWMKSQDSWFLLKESQTAYVSVNKINMIIAGIPLDNIINEYKKTMTKGNDSRPSAFENELIVENANTEHELPLVNEIFLIDPQTNQVHSVIRQIIPSGDKNVGEMAVKQLKDHLESSNNVRKISHHNMDKHFIDSSMHNEVLIYILIDI